MTQDLEETLQELGDGYGPVVDRLLAAYRLPAVGPEPSVEAERRSMDRKASAAAWGVALLAAASLVVFLGFGLVFRSEPPASRVYTVRASDAAHEYMLAIVRDDKAVQEMIRTQRADGGWGSDFLTLQNAAALRLCKGEDARLAYRKAMRNLRIRGVR